MAKLTLQKIKFNELSTQDLISLQEGCEKEIRDRLSRLKQMVDAEIERRALSNSGKTGTNN
jgi:phage-related protein